MYRNFYVIFIYPEIIYFISRVKTINLHNELKPTHMNAKILMYGHLKSSHVFDIFYFLNCYTDNCLNIKYLFKTLKLIWEKASLMNEKSSNLATQNLLNLK